MKKILFVVVLFVFVSPILALEIEFRLSNAPLTEFFKKLGSEADLKFAIDNDVYGTVNLFGEMTAEAALEAVLINNRLVRQDLSKGVIRIARLDTIRAEEQEVQYQAERRAGAEQELLRNTPPPAPAPP